MVDDNDDDADADPNNNLKQAFILIINILGNTSLY